MTTVPSDKLLHKQTSAVQPSYQNPRNVPSGAFDSGASGLISGGAEIGKFGEQAAQIAIKMQRDDNDAEVKKLDNEISAAIRQITYGDEKTPGYYSTEKQGALDSFVDTEDAIKKSVQEVLNGSTNPIVRKRAGELGSNRIERELDGMSRHASVERVKAHDEVGMAREAQATADAASAWNSDNVATTSLAIIEDENAHYASRHSLSEEAEGVRLMERKGAMVKEIFGAAVANSNMGRAQEIFNRFVGKGEIHGAVEADMRKTLDAGVLREKSQSETARIQAENPGDIRAQIEAAKKISDPKIQDEVVTRLDSDYARAKRIDEADRVAFRRDAWQEIISGKSVDNLPADQLAALDGTVISSMRAFELRRAQDGSGYSKVTEPAAYNEVHSLFMDDKAEFIKLDLTEYMGRMDEQDFKYWQSQQRAIDKNAEKEVAKGKSYTLADRMAKEYLNSANIGYTASATPADAAKAQKVLRLARDYVDDLEDGKKFDRAELDAEMSGLFLSGEVTGSGWFFTDKGRAFEFEGTAAEKDFAITNVETQKGQISMAAGLPEESVEGAVQALKTMNVPVTVDNLRGNFEISDPGNYEAHISTLTGVPTRHVTSVIDALTQRGKKVTPANIRSVYNSAVAKTGK